MDAILKACPDAQLSEDVVALLSVAFDRIAEIVNELDDPALSQEAVRAKARAIVDIIHKFASDLRKRLDAGERASRWKRMS